MRPEIVGAGRRLGRAGLVLLLAALMASACGCVGLRGRCTIVMTARGDSLERGIRIERIQSHEDSLRGTLRPDLEPGMSERLLSVYRVSQDTAATAPYAARGRFADVPDDIGTRGHYRHWATPLGEAFFYSERVRGMDDPAAWVERRLSSADSLAAGTAEWLRFELLTQPEWPRVESTLEPELRRIARTYASATLASVGQDTLQLGWLLSFAPEHPLFALLGASALEDTADAVRYAPYFARARADLARRMGLRSAADQARVLGFLADGPAILASYRGWAERAPGAAALDLDAAQRLILAMGADPKAQQSLTLVDVELRLPRKPFSTNGRWSDSARCVRWTGLCALLAEREVSLPMTCSAVWSVPDSIVQRRLFGDVVLEDDALFDYADWYGTLAPARRAEWDRMLLALRPGRLEPLERFRFRGEEGPADAAAYVRRLILNQIGPQTQPVPGKRGKPAPPARSR